MKVPEKFSEMVMTYFRVLNKPFFLGGTEEKLEVLQISQSQSRKLKAVNS
jgi:hypothetical protein